MQSTNVPDPDDTPKPWEDDEQSIRAGVRALATHILSRLDLMTQGIKLELHGISIRLDALEDRSNDTGRHLIQIAETAGEAKGMASSKRNSDNPISTIVRWGTKTAAERWISHIITAAVAAGLMWIWRKVHP